MRLRTIRSKLLVSILSIVIFPVCILGVWGYQIAQKALFQQSEAAIQSQLRQVGSEIENNLFRFNRYSKLVIFDANVQRLVRKTEFSSRNAGNRDEIRQLDSFFNEKINDLCLLSAGILKDGGGIFRYADSLELQENDLRASDWYQQALSGHGAAVWHLQKDHLVLARLIRDSADLFTWKNIGVVYLYISLDVLWKPITEAEQSTGWYIVDNLGNCLLSRNIGSIPRTSFSDLKYNTTQFGDSTFPWSLTLYRLNSPRWILVQQAPKSIMASLQALWLNTFALCAGSFILAVGFISFFIRAITKPLTQLRSAIQTVGHNDMLDMRLALRNKDEIGYIGNAFNQMLERIQDLLSNIQQEERERRNVELKMLQYQINPHFLYNALNTIRLMALLRGAQAIADSAAALTRLMQSAIGKFGEIVTLQMEFDTVRDYILIQNYRLNDRLTLTLPCISTLGSLRVPNFILQPIVENAVFHGIIPKGESGDIVISASRQCEKLLLLVEDNGIGIPEDKINALVDDSDETSSRCIGLRNVNRRIKISCGQQYGLRIRKGDSCGTTVEVWLPWEDENAESSLG